MTDRPADLRVEHEPPARRFVIRLPDGEAELAYSAPGGNVLDLNHTFVPADARRRGVADALVRGAIAHARGHGMRIVPTCPYVRAWMERHPHEHDIVATDY